MSVTIYYYFTNIQVVYYMRSLALKIEMSFYRHKSRGTKK